MEKTLFQGLCTALVTPFLDESINYPMVDLLIRRQIESGADAIVLAGTTGESPTLSDKEKLQLFRRGVRAAQEDCKIIAGTGSNSTYHTIELSKAAQDCGVNGLLVVSPYYNKATETGLISHFTAIANAVSIPIILYNVPSRTGVDIPLGVYRELIQHPNIAGIKEACGDISKVLKEIELCGSNAAVYSGNDDQAVAVIALGGKGLISVSSNILPLEMNAMVSAALGGDLPLASLLQRKLLPLTDLMFCQVNPIPVKEAMRMIGYDVGACRLPLDTLKAEYRQQIKAFLEHWQQIS